MTIMNELAAHFKLQQWQVENTITLIDEGNTIPFIARYRKERTGEMDDQTLRQFHQQLLSLRALNERREEIQRLINEQGKLTPALEDKIGKAKTLSELDDIYRPYRPKRKTRGSTAREKGLQPLADLLVKTETTRQYLEQQAKNLADASEDIEDGESALAGACDIVAEDLSDNAEIRQQLRRQLYQRGLLTTKKVPDYKDERDVYAMYAEYQEAIARLPGHRILAINRGEREKALQVKLLLEDADVLPVLMAVLPGPDSDMYSICLDIAKDAWKRLIFPSLTTDIRRQLTEQAEAGAMAVFASNLQNLLLQPPIREKIVLGIDPGFRTGCKLAVVEQTGRVLDTGVIYPTPPLSQTEKAAVIVLNMIKKHQVTLIAIGNGTASRETERFVAHLMKEKETKVPYLMVSEAGASVYSASPEAAEEFPEYDVSLRSAVSIARRVQDPLAELVKIEPRSIGVGQYQHDMHEKKLDEVLGGVVEACVNEVGVDLNTASSALLTYVAGLNKTLAKNITQYRDSHGRFKSRRELLKVPRMGPKAFEQSAGFLRIPNGDEWLDNTSIHPETYEQVYLLSQLLDCDPSPVLAEKAHQLPEKQLADKTALGTLTLRDILAALAKPGRDPRDDLPQPTLRSDVLELKDLKPDMMLQGVVRNVADFGAFVDIGVHQDGLVHISELADRYISKPMDIVKTGQPVNVKVLSVDTVRKRISLSMKGLKQP